MYDWVSAFVDWALEALEKYGEPAVPGSKGDKTDKLPMGVSREVEIGDGDSPGGSGPSGSTGGSDADTSGGPSGEGGAAVIAGDEFDTHGYDDVDLEGTVSELANPNPSGDATSSSPGLARLLKLLGIGPGIGETPDPDGGDDGSEGTGHSPTGAPGSGAGWAGSGSASGSAWVPVQKSGAMAAKLTGRRDHVWNPNPDDPFGSDFMPNPDDVWGIGGPNG